MLQFRQGRAENVMVVDLLRNDMSRVARPFSVSQSLFVPTERCQRLAK
jgi:anthranilate/para-aminobenzoate synthase component I